MDVIPAFAIVPFKYQFETNMVLINNNIKILLFAFVYWYHIPI